MPRKMYGQHNSSKFRDMRIQLEDLPKKTMKLTIHALRWMFFLIFIFITIGIIALFLTGGQNHIQNIIGYSITGFFTFFMGYFGWILAQSMIEMVTGKDDVGENSHSYYYKKTKRFKH